MILRKEQLGAFSEPELREFEQFMVGHLRKWFPDECGALGEEATRRRIREGIQQAERHGITGKRDVCKFIDVMFALGPRFDEDPALPWPRRILGNDGLEPSEKVNQLVNAALEHRRAAKG